MCMGKRLLGNDQPDDKRITVTKGLHEDTSLTNTKRYAKKALNKDLVANTWSEITDAGRRLTQDSPYGSEVLVGIPDPQAGEPHTQ